MKKSRNNSYLLKAQFIFIILVLYACSSVFPQNSIDSNANKPAPVKVIYETDFTFDVDDVGVLAVLHTLADNG